MKKIVLASAAMGGAALVAFGAAGTFASFTDSASSATSDAQAGTLFLVPSQANQEATAQAATVDDLAPGQEATYAFYVQNGGTLTGDLVGTFQLTSDAENDCLPVEGRKGDPSCTGANDGKGELGTYTAVRATYGAVASAADCTTGTTGLAQTFGYGTYTLASLDNQSGIAARVPAKQGFCAVVTIKVDPDGTGGNLLQSDSAAFSIDYTLAQATS